MCPVLGQHRAHYCREVHQKCSLIQRKWKTKCGIPNNEKNIIMLLNLSVPKIRMSATQHLFFHLMSKIGPQIKPGLLKLPNDTLAVLLPVLLGPQKGVGVMNQPIISRFILRGILWWVEQRWPCAEPWMVFPTSQMSELHLQLHFKQKQSKSTVKVQ